VTARVGVVRRGRRLTYLTLGYNTAGAIVSVVAGLVAGRVALVGFGVDSAIEVTAAVAARWPLRAVVDEERRERVERVAHRIIGGLFLALAGYVAIESVTTLWRRKAPDGSPVGLLLLVLILSVVGDARPGARQAARGSRAREPGPGSRCRPDLALRLPVGDRAPHGGAQHCLFLVVDRSGRCPRAGADHRQRGPGGLLDP
jgi:hypothetical protein